MPKLVTTVLFLLFATYATAEEPAKNPTTPITRTIQGRVVDADGRPVTQGKVYFSISDWFPKYTNEGTAELGPDGMYHLELKDYKDGDLSVPASNARRYTVVAAGFQAEQGLLAAGVEAATLDFRLSPAEWKTTSLRFVDQRNHPVAGVDVDVQIARNVVWATLKSDREGICRVVSPPRKSAGILVDSRDYLPIECSISGGADDPTEVVIPMFDPIRGRVIDPAGTPQKRVEIGGSIGSEYDANIPNSQLSLYVNGFPNPYEPEKTDDQGRFALRPKITLDNRGRDRSGTFRLPLEPLCFADSTLRNMAFLGVDLKNPLPMYEVVLKPARHVRIPLDHGVASTSGKYEVEWGIYALVDRSDSRKSIRVMSGGVGPRQSDGDWLEAYWPEGKYSLNIASRDPVADKGLEETTIEVDVPSGEGPLILPKLLLTGNYIVKLVGKPAPEIEARDLDTRSPIRLADYRGKVVVLDFWGYWCGPCVSAMPGLMKIHDKYQGRPVVVLALHDQSVQTREAYDVKLENVKRNIWNGRDLPFRVAVDTPAPDIPKDEPGIAHGVTCSRYEILNFPTTLVIGPDGVVAGSASLRTPGALEALIDTVLPKASP
ncbi:TlpA family protein disulfide reductase [Paludisphaera rhizosphaerae]|uniref:TlpA family protein disulfide reductase n=1 Tax=Paludisphaera rhizosphaerae TaxID=2711216 RepID=UPI0013E9AD1D|nr:redoxin domain-containing protein [Paludisphaera rhizosphaerae]